MKHESTIAEHQLDTQNRIVNHTDLRKNPIRMLVYISLFSALFIVLGLIQIKLTASAVPFSLQTLGVTLAAIFLRPKQAFISVFICIIIGTIGLPIFGGKGGIGHVLGPTGGFIVYFAFGACLLSYIIHNTLQKKLTIKHYVLLFICYYGIGAFASYFIGIPWFMIVTSSSLEKAISVAFYPFIIGDLLKALLALFVTASLQKYIVKTRQGLPL